MKKSLALLMLVAISVPAFAAKPAKDADKSFENKDLDEKVGDWGMAGCGLGSIVMKGKRDKVSQVVAATTNGTLWNNTFAASFGTSNCDPKQALTAQTTRKNAELFVSANRSQLELDVARLNGEALVGLTEVMGCSNADKVGAALHQNYAGLFNNATDAELGNKIVDTMNSAGLSSECRYL